MEVHRTLTAPCSPERLFAWIEDLAVYPLWMRLVHQVTPLDDQAADRADDRADRQGSGQAADTGDGPAWQVELRAQVGPFARSKSLRMVRTVHEPSSRVTFERQETDGRQHSPWVLRATVAPAGDSSTLTMELQYGGSLWGGSVLQRVLDDAVRRGSDDLLDLVSDAPERE